MGVFFCYQKYHKFPNMNNKNISVTNEFVSTMSRTTMYFMAA